MLAMNRAASYLLLGLALVASPAAALDENTTLDRAIWAVDPAHPGPNQPPVGRSLFDELFQADARSVHQIPFPFTALVEDIQRHLAPDEPLVRVLIPKGRSLQRYAAAPNYYRYPRVVVAVNGEPRQSPEQAGIFLKNLLFLGYQEKANTIEVISYNDEAARFEFQMVLEYGPGLTPYAINAERGMCMSCHQNGGPIFPQAPWQETDSRYSISELIQAERPEFYAGPLFAPHAKTAWALDYATDRANYFASYQLLWQRACGDQVPLSEQSVRCRAAVLEAIVKFRLNGAWYVDAEARNYRENVVEVVSNRWDDLWPGGIYVPTADIPDRDPLVDTVVSRILDPTLPRPPRAYWTRPALEILCGFVRRLAELVSRDDIKRIDRTIHALALEGQTEREEFNSTCTLIFDRSNPRRLKLECEPAQEGGKSFDLQGWFEFDQGKITRGKLNTLVLAGKDQTIGTSMKDNLIEFDLSGGHLLVSFAQPGELNPRRRNGDLVEALEISWIASHSDHLQGDATLTVLADFHHVSAAVEIMIDEALTGRSDSLAVRPFRRRSVIQALNRLLGMSPIAWN